MRGWLTIATVGAALATTPAWAQGRAAHSGFAAPRPAIVGHAAVVPRSSFIVHSAPGFRPHYYRFRIGSRWPYVYYGYYPGYYPWYPLFGDTYDSASNGYNPQSYQLQQEVNQLSDELERLREEHAEWESTRPPLSPPRQSQSPSKAEGSLPTTLVFRDGKVEQVHNYAIVGPTLWVFNEQRTRKIPLSELDIPATQKANEELGVPFHTPPAHL